MYIRKALVRIYHTDMAGVIFFGSIYQLAQDTLEDFLFQFDHQVVPYARPYYLPVVHSEADYLHPIQMGDLLHIEMSVENMGNSSIITRYSLFNEALEAVATIRLVSVSVSKETRKKIPLPEEVRHMFGPLLVNKGTEEGDQPKA